MFWKAKSFEQHFSRTCLTTNLSHLKYIIIIQFYFWTKTISTMTKNNNPFYMVHIFLRCPENVPGEFDPETKRCCLEHPCHPFHLFGVFQKAAAMFLAILLCYCQPLRSGENDYFVFLDCKLCPQNAKECLDEWTHWQGEWPKAGVNCDIISALIITSTPAHHQPSGVQY